jgi:hypothetical protein
MGGLRKVCKLLISRLARILANDKTVFTEEASSSLRRMAVEDATASLQLAQWLNASEPIMRLAVRNNREYVGLPDTLH